MRAPRIYALRPIVITILILYSSQTVNSNKYKVENSNRKSSSRRRSRQPLDRYSNEEPQDDFRQSYRTESIRNYDNDNKNYENNENYNENYDQNYDNYNNDDETEPVAYVREDLVDLYTKKFPSKIMVSVCSGICSSILLSLIMKMVINQVFPMVVVALSICCSFSCFTKKNSDINEFSKALGVFFLLLIQRAKPKTFVSQFTKQVTATVMATSRKPFPPSENPWKYNYDPEVKGSIKFKMINSIVGIILCGTVIGWSISRYVPLLPGWLGAVTSAAFLGYLGTLKDSIGDVLRFVGYSLDECMTYLFATSNDVLLGEKSTVLFQRIFSIILRFEKQNKIFEKLSLYFGKIIEMMTSFFKSVRSDITSDDQQKEQGGSNKGHDRQEDY
mmetsp:Transcript_10318/g.9966  ORF Transcript_10318/g.9966 Transcript_10318/m.9966 type:complete len:388 (+) Transcript_10318:182-1345(+)